MSKADARPQKPQPFVPFRLTFLGTRIPENAGEKEQENRARLQPQSEEVSAKQQSVFEVLPSCSKTTNPSIIWA